MSIIGTIVNKMTPRLFNSAGAT